MSDSFQPLSNRITPRDGTAFRMKVVASDSAAEPFKSLQPAAKKTGESGAEAAEHEPQVSLQKEGDRVTGARIECSCGQVIELAFTFQTGS